MIDMSGWATMWWIGEIYSALRCDQDVLLAEYLAGDWEPMEFIGRSVGTEPATDVGSTT